MVIIIVLLSIILIFSIFIAITLPIFIYLFKDIRKRQRSMCNNITSVIHKIASANLNSDEREAALNLLAVMHSDGGHYTESVGFLQSCKDAEQVRNDLMLKIDNLEHGYNIFEDGPIRPEIN